MRRKTESVVVKEIRIPVDFKDLHDLKELVQNYEFVSRLQNALNSYQQVYVESFLLDLKGVLKYIPETDHDLYRVNGYRSNDAKYRDMLEKRLLDTISYSRYEGAFYGDEKLKAAKKHNASNLKQARFFVDIKSKDAVLCHWTINKSLNYDKRKYTGFEYKVDTENNKLIAISKYNYIYSQRVGGSFIHTFKGNGYYTGGKEVEMEGQGKDLYTFCTRTNIFLGHKNEENGSKKANIEGKSYY